jgi:hypothetical protein
MPAPYEPVSPPSFLPVRTEEGTCFGGTKSFSWYRLWSRHQQILIGFLVKILFQFYPGDPRRVLAPSMGEV